MRIGQLSRALDDAVGPRHWKSAWQLYLTSTPDYQRTGAEIAREFGLMLHYTRADFVGMILGSASIGLAEAVHGFTPTA